MSTQNYLVWLNGGVLPKTSLDFDDMEHVVIYETMTSKQKTIYLEAFGDTAKTIIKKAATKAAPVLKSTANKSLSLSRDFWKRAGAAITKNMEQFDAVKELDEFLNYLNVKKITLSTTDDVERELGKWLYSVKGIHKSFINHIFDNIDKKELFEAVATGDKFSNLFNHIENSFDGFVPAMINYQEANQTVPLVSPYIKQNSALLRKMSGTSSNKTLAIGKGLLGLRDAGFKIANNRWVQAAASGAMEMSNAVIGGEGKNIQDREPSSNSQSSSGSSQQKTTTKTSNPNSNELPIEKTMANFLTFLLKNEANPKLREYLIDIDAEKPLSDNDQKMFGILLHSCIRQIQRKKPDIMALNL